MSPASLEKQFNLVLNIFNVLNYNFMTILDKMRKTKIFVMLFIVHETIVLSDNKRVGIHSLPPPSQCRACSHIN